MAHVGVAQVPKTVTEVEKDTDLPKALVKKIVKNKINQTLAYNAAPDAQEPKKDIQINKDALLAFSESAKVINICTIRIPIGFCSLPIFVLHRTCGGMTSCCVHQVFISYLTSAANDICKEAKRQTISAEDVFTALQDLEFGELISPLKEALEGTLTVFDGPSS